MLQQEPLQFWEPIRDNTKAVLCNCFIGRLPENTGRYQDRECRKESRKEPFDEVKRRKYFRQENKFRQRLNLLPELGNDKNDKTHRGNVVLPVVESLSRNLQEGVR